MNQLGDCQYITDPPKEAVIGTYDMDLSVLSAKQVNYDISPFKSTTTNCSFHIRHTIMIGEDRTPID